jgi:hypothetical protein
VSGPLTIAPCSSPTPSVGVPKSRTEPASRDCRTPGRTTALAVVTELFRDWAGPLYEPALDVIYWYFTEVPMHTDQVGVADAEKRAAAARGAH